MSHIIMYKELIENEKKISREFLIKQQILEERFNEEEYKLIKEILKQEKVIDKIYEVIDFILKEEKIDKENRFLILADFLFSMCSFEITDPSNIVLKLTRNDFIKNIIIRAEINSLMGWDFKKYIKIQKKLIIGLRKEKILEKNVIRIKDDEWETIVYIRLKIEDIKIEDISPIGISNFPFRISFDKRYIIGSFRNIWKTKRKKREMEDFKICIESVIISNNIKFNLERKNYEIMKEKIEEYKINILKEVECSSIKEYFEKIKLLLIEKKYMSKSIKNKEIRDETEWNDIIKWKIKIKDEYWRKMKNFQKIISINILEREIFEKEHYLPCFIDNRGRQYYGTLVSPTFYKIFRYMYSFKEKKEFKELKESRFFKEIIKYKELVNDFKLDEIKSYQLLILFIEIGKFFLEKGKIMTETEEIIKKGIENFKNQREEKDFDDELYIIKIKKEIEKIIKGEEMDINTIIFKDATASGLQNYGIILGYKKEKLSYLNLDGDKWCDTYQYLIDKFLVGEEKFKKRKYWKSTIMTIPYKASWITCFEKFKEKLEEDGMVYSKMNKKEKDLIKNMHIDFYKKIRKKVKEEFFIEKQGELKEFKYNEWKIVNKKEYKINYQKMREKYTDILYMLIEDKKGTKRAIEANNMHYLDSQLVKEILKKYEILPIHDCFGMRMCELHLIMDEINKYYSKIIKENTYSINILK